MKYLILALFLSLTSCALLSPSKSADNNELAQDPAALQRLEEEKSLHQAEDLMARGHFEKGIATLKNFQQKNPQSSFYQASRLSEAEGLQGLGRYQEAANLLREIYLATSQEQPPIAARALYASSFSYEAMGDDLKTLAALLDSQKLASQLPPEIANAEIPARLASVYGRQGREKEALQYLSEADKGLTDAIAGKSAAETRAWLGKTYLQMGTVSTNQLSAESFATFSQGQIGVQVYLLRALSLNDPVWSLRAQNKLQETYRDLATVFEATSKDIPKQTQLAGDFYDLMDQAELHRPAKELNIYQKEFFAYLSQIRSRMDKLLYSDKELMGLTEESKRLNGLRRSGRVKADSSLPEERKSTISLPPKVVPTEDPNL